MGKALQLILSWSEVWALFIPLLVLIIVPKQPAVLRPVIVYVWIAFVLNFLIDLIIHFKKTYHFPAWLQSNNSVYNIHSILMFGCFSYFFLSLKPPFFKTLKWLLLLAALLFVVVDFTFFEGFFYPGHLSGNLLSTESYLLLIYCLLYYLSILNAEGDIILKDPGFWIVTGLSFYVAVNFFVFLFYVPMIAQNLKLAINIWNVHNVAYIILCLFIAKAFYATSRN